ncbi:MAG: hypothetical protein GY866_24305 [Proteobacteria bacterium]|nr:hypothetical protein [Pseudomonadota bacterium]
MSEKKGNTQQFTDLKSIGAILKKKREERSYTLEHIAEITKITLSSLRDIEEGNLEELPVLVFVQGFVRNYAKELGLESDWMIEALNQAYSGDQQQSQESASREKDLESVPKSAGNKNTYIFVGAILCTALVVFFLYWNIRTSNKYSSITGKVETIQAVEPQTSSQEIVQKTPELELNNSIDRPAPKTVISPLTLTLVALENEWIRLSIDDQEAFDLRIKKGKKYEWPAKEEYSLIMTTGNSALIHLNGEEIIDRENYPDQLYQTKLNKFTLTRINNR